MSRLENGRGTEDVRILREVAQVLAILPQHLGLAAASDPSPADPETEDMGRRTVLAAGIAALAAPAIPSAAHRDLVQALLPGAARVTAEPVPDLQKLRDQVAGVRRLFYTCDYTKLEGALPGLIGQLRQAISDTPGSSDVSSLLATAYQTSASLLLKQSDQGNAWLAVGRAMAEAERSGAPAVLASSVRVHAYALTRDSRYVTLDGPDAWANFSPTNVALLGLSAAVAFGDAGVALEPPPRSKSCWLSSSVRCANTPMRGVIGLVESGCDRASVTATAG